jgi:hypothetical protein
VAVLLLAVRPVERLPAIRPAVVERLLAIRRVVERLLVIRRVVERLPVTRRVVEDLLVTRRAAAAIHLVTVPRKVRLATGLQAEATGPLACPA